MLRLLALICLLPTSALAAMTAEEFEAYVAGQTLTYYDQGQPYGVEEYLQNRRVRWAFVGGECTEGFWYEADGGICFVYENNPDAAQCWQFDGIGGRLTATFLGGDDSHEVYEAERSDQPMVCLGPDIGV